jgi:hypothetical protein
VRKGTAPHITSALNPAADIVGRVCQVYRHGVRRHLVSTSKTKAQGFAQLYREAGIASLGPDWNRIGYYCGPTFAIPQVRSDLMRCETIVPHRRVLVLDEENPTGWPIAIAYKAANKLITIIEQTRIRDYKVTGDSLEVVPGSGRDYPKADQSNPYAGLRFDAPLDPCDWDESRKHDRLTDASLDVTAIGAVMGFVRSTQNKVLLYMSGRLDKLAKGQNLGDPTTPILADVDQGSQVQVAGIPFNTPVTDFLNHIRFWYAAAAESTGVPAMIAADGAKFDLEFAYDGLSELRDEQIGYADAFEMDLAVAMILAAEAGKHPLWVAGKLPTVEEVRKNLRIEFGHMARRFADPGQQRDQADWEVRHGLISIADLLAKRFPQIDREELLKQIEETLEENGKLWDMLAARNVGADASGKAITGAQQNGAKGPAERDKGKVTNDDADS